MSRKLMLVCEVNCLCAFLAIVVEIALLTVSFSLAAAVADESAGDSEDESPDLDISTAPPEYQQLLTKLDFQARYVRGTKLEVLDTFLPPLNRKREEMLRYGKDVSVVFRILTRDSRLLDETGKKMTALDVKLKPVQQGWPYKTPLRPTGPIGIPLKTFSGGLLYQLHRVYGPMSGIGDKGVGETLVSRQWLWQVSGTELKPVDEIRLFPADAVDPNLPVTAEAKLAVVARFVTGKQMRILEQLFDQRISEKVDLSSDDDLYLLLRLHTIESFGTKTQLIKTWVDVFTEEWNFPSAPFPSRTIELKFIHFEDGVVYEFIRLDDLPKDWGRNGAREHLLSRPWNARCRGGSTK